MAGGVGRSWRDVTDHPLSARRRGGDIGVASLRPRLLGHRVGDQTAGLVESWRDISKRTGSSLTVGIVTPILSALALSAPIDIAAHQED